MKRIIITFILVVGSSFLFGQNNADSLINLSQFEFAYPYWSPDGNQIVFQSNLTGNWQLYRRDNNTNEIVRLMENKANDITPAWSPDGSKILFTSDRDGEEEIFTYDVKTRSVTQLTNNTTRDIHPNWSPDGKRIIFNGAKKLQQGDKLIIQLMDSDGKNIKTIREDENTNSYASFSPDGKKITFLKWLDKGKNGEIYIMNADGTGEERLTNNKVWDAWPTWSSSGEDVIYASSVPGVFKLFQVNIKTKETKQLTFGNEEDARANCHPDGKQIVFNRGESGKIDILVLKLK